MIVPCFSCFVKPEEQFLARFQLLPSLSSSTLVPDLIEDPGFVSYVGFRPHTTRSFCFGKRTQNHWRPGVALRVPLPQSRLLGLRNSLRSDSPHPQIDFAGPGRSHARRRHLVARYDRAFIFVLFLSVMPGLIGHPGFLCFSLSCHPGLDPESSVFCCFLRL